LQPGLTLRLVQPSRMGENTVSGGGEEASKAGSRYKICTKI
jgi:hypothetical protein